MAKAKHDNILIITAMISDSRRLTGIVMPFVQYGSLDRYKVKI